MDEATVAVKFFNGQSVDINIKTRSFDDVLTQSDFVTLHVPAQDKPTIGTAEMAKMKKGAGLINAARGGVVDEQALVNALESKQLSFAALDTFVNEPTPAVKLLMHPSISLTPHIGAATHEAQNRIGTELAQQIKDLLKK
jgi:D-3-phosphoglycerate dehydrogenase